MKISLIVAMTPDRVIGRNNELPWHLSADLRRFKRLTMGHHLLVGRKTYESIGRPLPGRTMLVVSRSEQEVPVEVAVLPSIEAAVEAARAAGEDELFVAGGAEVYRQTMRLADGMYVTQVGLDVEGDAFFPEIDLAVWEEVEREEHPADDTNPIAHAFLRYRRLEADDEARPPGADRRPR